MEYSIRDASNGDLDKIIDIKERVRTTTYLRLYKSLRDTDLLLDKKDLRNKYSKLLQDPNEKWLVAECNGELLGYISAKNKADYGYLRSLFVKDEFQGYKIGSSLTQKILMWFANKKKYPIKVLVLTKNKKALNFYKSLGFTRIEKSSSKFHTNRKREISMYNIYLDRRDIIFTTEADHSAQLLVTQYPNRFEIILYNVLEKRGAHILFKDSKELLDKRVENKGIILRDPYNTNHNYEKILQGILQEYSEKIELDYKVLSKYPNYEDKLFQAGFIKKMGLTLPTTWHFKRFSQIDLKEWPVLMKQRISSRNKGNFIVNNINEIREHIGENRLEDYIFQEIINFEKDLRCLVLKGKIIGTVERNTSKNAEKYIVKVGENMFDLPKIIKDQCVKLSKELGADLLGIDLLKKGNKYFFIETNVSPQFRRFCEVAKVDIGKELINNY